MMDSVDFGSLEHHFFVASTFKIVVSVWYLRGDTEKI